MPVNTSITLRKGSSSQWSTTNPVLASGEPGYDLTNNILKIGDGVSSWNNLTNHKHSSSDITNFNSSVSGLLPTISNSGNNKILTSTGSNVGINAENNLTFDGNLLKVIGSIQSSGEIFATTSMDVLEDVTLFRGENYWDGTVFSVDGRGAGYLQHGLFVDGYLNVGGNVNFQGSGLLTSNINNFNSSVSGLLPTISNSGDNRLLTSTGSSVGINAENNLTFNGSFLNVNGSGYFASGIIAGSPSIIGNSVIGQYIDISSDGLILIRQGVDGTPILSCEESTLFGDAGVTSVLWGSRILSDASGDNVLYWGAQNKIGIRNGDPQYTLDVNGSGNFASGLYVNNIPVSVSGHTHTTSNISGLNASATELNYLQGVTPGSGLGNKAVVLNALGSAQIPFINTYGLEAEAISVSDPNYSSVVYLEPAHDSGGSSKLVFIGNNAPNGSIEADEGAEILNFVGPWNLNGTPISVSGHSHSSSDITNFNSSVSGLLPVTNILGGSNITVSKSGTDFTIAVTGSLGLTTEEVDDRVAGLLVAGSGISLNYNDSANTLTVDSNVSTSLVAGSGISLNYNISTDELSIGLSSPIFVSGNNFGIGTSSPSSALDINSDSLRIRTSRTPASAAASGNAGDICWDANYLYVCVATNTWKRSAITTW